jgi:acetoin utilization deacetylase AcuC-like enzyme
VTALVLAGPSGISEHDGGPHHPERPSRLMAVMDGVGALGLGDDVVRPDVVEATLEELARVHDAAYLARLEAFCADGGGVLNNVAVAAASRTARGERVLIVDWDVHHGNGTQAIFWDDPAVLYVSTHQHPLYPGSGAPDEVGGTGAPGLTVNVPLPPGATGDVARAAVDVTARPAIEAFAPDWVLVSCGFDAHRDDPLGQLALSSGDFADLARVVSEFAPRPGRLALFLEGGYNPASLQSSVQATLGALVGSPVDAERPTSGGPGLEQVRAVGSERRRAIDRIEGELSC